MVANLANSEINISLCLAERQFFLLPLSLALFHLWPFVPCARVKVKPTPLKWTRGKRRDAERKKIYFYVKLACTLSARWFSPSVSSRIAIAFAHQLQFIYAHPKIIVKNQIAVARAFTFFLLVHMRRESATQSVDQRTTIAIQRYNDAVSRSK